MRQNPIPQRGSWDAISGEEFLRKLLTQGVDETRYKGGVSDPLFSCVGSIGIDPRALGQRIMDIRTALAAEFIQVQHSAARLCHGTALTCVCSCVRSWLCIAWTCGTHCIGTNVAHSRNIVPV